MLYFLPLPLPFFWDRALPAAAFDALLVRPSFSTLAAALAALVDVLFSGALVWASALAAAVLDFVAVLGELRVLDACLAAFGLVVLDFDFAISIYSLNAVA